MTTTIRLPEELDARLAKLAAVTHRAKSFYIREAIKQYLDDMEDAYIALDRITKPNRKMLSTEQVLEELEK